ncbi:MAG TPA: AAA family ATPase [Solirubrobacteraceae bacterium]|nr:AAA family ATPase [Solirubrobacteraceae bacterium]
MAAVETDPTPLLERDRELAWIAAAIAAGGEGAGRLLIVEGDPGVGKSSVLAHSAAEARRQGTRAFTARGGVFEQAAGFGVAQQLFESSLTSKDPERLFEGAAALARPLLDSAEVTVPVDPIQARHGLFWLLSNLAEAGPIALLLDDAQWCDGPSLDWLLYLARRIEGLSVTVVVTVGLGEPDAAHPIFEALAAEPVCETRRLAPLGLTGTTELLGSLLGTRIDDGFAAACHEWTGGNPSFLSEVAAELTAEGLEPGPAATERLQSLAPERISTVTLLRLRRLPPSAERLASALAILGFDCTLPQAAAIAGLEREEAVDAADALVESRFVERTPQLRFLEPLIGRVIYDDLPPTRRAADHKRAARLLYEDGAATATVAAQLLRSDPDRDQWTVERLCEAATAQLATGSSSAAVPLLRRALAEPPAIDELASIQTMLGLAESIAGEPSGLDSLRSALAASDGAVPRAHSALLLARFLVFAGLGGEAVATVEPALAELDGIDEDLRLQLEAALVTAARSDVGLREIADAHLDSIRKTAEVDSHVGRVVAVQCAYSAAAEGVSAEKAIGFARTALRGRRLLDEAPLSPDVYLVPISMLAICDELDEADDHYREALRRAREGASPLAYASTAAMFSWTKYLRGELAKAELLARDALRIASESPALEAIKGFATVHLAIVLIERGEPEASLELLGPGLESVSSHQTWARETEFATGRALLAMRRPEESLERFFAAGERSESFGIVNPAFLPWRSLAAQAMHELGDDVRALELSGTEVEIARRFGARRPLGIALRAHGLLVGGDDGIGLLQESTSVLGDSPAVLQRSHSLVSLGSALRRAGRRAEARDPLAEGLRLAESCGAAPLAKLAREELGAGGARPRADGRWDADALTISELRICRMAAEGLSNPAIAQALFVTRGTVESHLHVAYRKLGIASRKALPEALAAYG